MDLVTETLGNLTKVKFLSLLIKWITNVTKTIKIEGGTAVILYIEVHYYNKIKTKNLSISGCVSQTYTGFNFKRRNIKNILFESNYATKLLATETTCCELK